MLVITTWELHSFTNYLPDNNNDNKNNMRTRTTWEQEHIYIIKSTDRTQPTTTNKVQSRQEKNTE